MILYDLKQNHWKKLFEFVAFLKLKSYICIRNFKDNSLFIVWRGARVVMEQIANLSTRKCCPGSNPGLSALKW